MSRPAMVYLVMVVVLIGGLWTVLEIGGYLAAPEDLAGKWQIQPVQPLQSNGAAFDRGSGPGGPGLNIEQSGKFFQLTFEHGPQLDLKLQSDSPMVLAGGNWTLSVAGHVGGDDKVLKLDRTDPAHPDHSEWSAHRLVRTFPLDPSIKGAP